MNDEKLNEKLARELNEQEKQNLNNRILNDEELARKMQEEFNNDNMLK